MVPAVVVDADVLFGPATRRLVVALGRAGALRVHWSARILDELARALARQGWVADAEAALAVGRWMDAALGGARVEAARLDPHDADARRCVNDADDAHVVACALAVRLGDPGPEPVLLATRNLRDFRAGPLARRGVAVRHPDRVLASLAPAALAAAAAAVAPGEARALAAALARDGNGRTAAALAAATGLAGR